MCAQKTHHVYHRRLIARVQAICEHQSRIQIDRDSRPEVNKVGVALVRERAGVG